ncbi:urea transporter [Kaistella carnis]|uniref:urea transporter n=1 Tax=Kaistella carnis TaxID=1241979 RepID=UPI002898F1CF|nr:urea transporter [Kaistella carnis]
MKFIEIILRGVGQVLFQNNYLSGLLFLTGIFYNSWLFGLAAIAGTIISTVSAQILNYSKEDIKNGLFGFNGALTGIAILVFFEPTLGSIVALIVGSVLSTVVMNFLKKIVPPFTAPFVLVTWILIYSLVYIFKFPLETEPSSAVDYSFQIIESSGKSFGQVMFQNNAVTGFLFLVAILINDKLAALYAVYAAVAGSLFGWLFSASFSSINDGLMGYNAILCAIALGGTRKKDLVWITFAIILSTLVQIGLGKTGIITLTAPFVLTTWIVLGLKELEERKKKIAN